MSAGNGSHAGTQVHRSIRFRVEALSYIELGPGNGGMIIGVSEGGLSFQGVLPLDRRQLLPVSFKLPGIKSFLTAACQIAWLNESAKGGGLCFVDMPDESRRLLNDWLAKRMLPPEAEESAAHRHEDVAGNIHKFDPGRRTMPASIEAPAEVGENTVRVLREISPSNPSYSGGANLAVPGAHSAVFAASASLPGPPVKPDHDSVRKSPIEIGKLRWLLACAAATAIIGTASFLVLHGRTAHPVAVASQSGDDSLGLKLERRGSDWQINWNRNADSVLKAIGGHLSITDGQSRKDLDLEPSELRGGSIVYTPLTSDVLVRLQLVGGNSDSPVSESVRVLSGASAPLPVEKPGNRALPGNSEEIASGTRSSDPTISQRQGPAPRPPIALELKTPRRTGSSAVPSVPSDSGSRDIAPADPGGSLSSEVRGVSLSAPSVPPLARPAVATPSTATPAQLLEGRNPTLPQDVRQMGISGTVAVHFYIGKDGRVSQVNVTKGNPLLARAVVDAVLARRYRPATIGGNPVESESDAVFVFNPK